MTSKTKKTTTTHKKKTTTKKATTNLLTTDIRELKIGTHEGQIFASVPYTLEDFKNALLIVSLGVNLFFLIGWLVLEVSQEYAYTVATTLVQ